MPQGLRHLCTVSLLAVVALVCGCQSSGKREQLPTDQHRDQPKNWIPALTLAEAQSCSLHVAKAILIARAALEEQAHNSGFGEPQVMEFRVEDTPTDIIVRASYVGMWDQGRPFPAPGYFSTVYIGKDWHVEKIVGGA